METGSFGEGLVHFLFLHDTYLTAAFNGVPTADAISRFHPSFKYVG